MTTIIDDPKGAVDAIYANARSYNDSAIALPISKGMDELLWLETRKRTIGASQSAAALAVSRYQTPYRTWLEMTGQVKPPNLSQKASIIAGNMLEDVIRTWFENVTRREVVRVNEMLVSKPYPFMACNLDGRILKEPAGLECKFAGHWAGSSEEWGPTGSSDTDAVPLAYLMQCVHSMIVTGWKRMYLAVLIGGNDFRWYTINFDPELATMVVDGLKAFKAKVDASMPYLAAGQPVPKHLIPPPTTMNDVFARWPLSEPVPIVATPEIVELLDEYVAVKQTVKTGEARAEELKLEFATFMGACDTLQLQMHMTDTPLTLATFKTSKAGKSFDVAAHALAHPDHHAEFLKDKKPARPFVLKEAAGL